MSATTAADVRRAFTRAAAAASFAGLDSSRWAMGDGSQTYGRAYRLHDLDPTTGAHSNPAGLWDSFLGMTRREAVLTLGGMASAFGAIAERERNGHAMPDTLCGYHASRLGA